MPLISTIQAEPVRLRHLDDPHVPGVVLAVAEVALVGRQVAQAARGRAPARGVGSARHPRPDLGSDSSPQSAAESASTRTASS